MQYVRAWGRMAREAVIQRRLSRSSITISFRDTHIRYRYQGERDALAYSRECKQVENAPVRRAPRYRRAH